MNIFLCCGVRDCEEIPGRARLQPCHKETGYWRLQPLGYASRRSDEGDGDIASLGNSAAWEETMLWGEQPTAAAKADRREATYGTTEVVPFPSPFPSLRRDSLSRNAKHAPFRSTDSYAGPEFAGK